MFGGDTGDSLSGNEGDVFFINTENASIHGFAYDQGLVCDMYFVPDENTIDEQWLWIMTKKFVSTNNTDVQFSYMSLEQGPKLNTAYSPKDTGLSTSTGASSFVNFNIPIWLEYHKYRPDGSANLMKKYRSMIIEGSIPNHTKYSFNFTDSYTTGWPVGTDLVSTNSQDMVGPLTSRIGINQRARGLTFRLFRASENYTETPVNPLNINRITVLWSYTGRAPTGRNPAWGKDPQSSL